MDDKFKEERIKQLYHELDLCGQILSEWYEEKPPTQYRRDYRRIINELRKLEPENWNYPCFQKKDFTKRNEAVEKFCSEHPCRKCGGRTKQTRSGSLRIICTRCGQKYQLKTK